MQLEIKQPTIVNFIALLRHYNSGDPNGHKPLDLRGHQLQYMQFGTKISQDTCLFQRWKIHVLHNSYIMTTTCIRRIVGSTLSYYWSIKIVKTVLDLWIAQAVVSKRVVSFVCLLCPNHHLLADAQNIQLIDNQKEVCLSSLAFLFEIWQVFPLLLRVIFF